MTNEDLPDWATEMDEEILNTLMGNLVLTPAIIAENIGRSREAVSRRLSTLEAGGLIKKIDRGKYKITDAGFFIISERADTSEEETKEAARADHQRQKAIKEQLGITEQEYRRAVEEEFNNLLENDRDTQLIDNLLRKAFENVEKREHSQGSN